MPAWRQITPAAQPPDPYYQWGHETSFIDLFPHPPRKIAGTKLFPVLLELGDGVALSDFALGINVAKEFSATFSVPPIYADPPAGLAKASFCTALVTQDFFRQVVTERAARLIKRVELGFPLADRQPQPWKKLPARRTGAKVVTGIIDDGIAFGHDRFRLRNGKSRIEAFWNQDGVPPAPPAGFDHGWELTKSDAGGIAGIDKLLSDCQWAGLVDEERVYAYAKRRHIDYGVQTHKPVAQRVAHGTHIMDIAAGYPMEADCREYPIIGVQLPVATTEKTSGATLAPNVLDGLWYILARADSLSPQRLPVVVNLSYGFFAGPHNGTSVLEAAIDNLIAAREAEQAPLRVVVPAGNNRLQRCHAEVSPAPGKKDAQPLRWRILPDDLTPSFIEMWLPITGNAPATVQVMVTTPTNSQSSPIKPGEEWVWEDGGEVLCKVIYLTAGAPGRTRPMIFFAVAPTATLDSRRKVAPSGEWLIKIENTGNPIDPRNPIHAWIQRDDTPYGYPVRGRQSRFEDKTYERFDVFGREVETDNASYIKRDATLNAIATGGESVVVGGFRRRDWKAAKYSASGSVVDPGRGNPSPDGPDALAVTDDSFAHRGILAAGTRSNSVVQLSGTSVGAPQFTRYMANDMANGGSCTRQDIADSTNANAPADPDAKNEVNPPAYAPAAPTPQRGGAGRMEFPRRIKLRFEKKDI